MTSQMFDSVAMTLDSCLMWVGEVVGSGVLPL